MRGEERESEVVEMDEVRPSVHRTVNAQLQY